MGGWLPKGLMTSSRAHPLWRLKHLLVEVGLVQEVHVEDVRVLADGPQEDLHLHQVHHHPVGREDVTHQVLEHDEGLHEEVLVEEDEE